MKTAYIAHPYGDNPTKNLKAVQVIIREMILEKQVLPFCPWHAFVHALDDTNPGERGLGMMATTSFIKKQYCDELHLHGSFISEGMRLEINAAVNNNIPIRIKSKEISEEMFIETCLKSGLKTPKFLIA
jgi:hypothetical protein